MKEAQYGSVDIHTQAESIVSWLRSAGFDGKRISLQFPTFKSICTVPVFTFSVRDGRTGRWCTSRHR